MCVLVEASYSSHFTGALIGVAKLIKVCETYGIVIRLRFVPCAPHGLWACHVTTDWSEQGLAEQSES